MDIKFDNWFLITISILFSTHMGLDFIKFMLQYMIAKEKAKKSKS